MSPINLRILLLLFTLILSNFSAVAYADDCVNFVRRTVLQQDKNLFNLCGYRGSQWTSSRKQLFRECRAMSKRDRARRFQTRDKLLTSCATVEDTSGKFTSFGRNRQQKLFSALLTSIRRQDQNLVRSILGAGINIGTQPAWLSRSPLFLAVKLGNYHLARILIRSGARPYLLAPGEVNPINLLLQKKHTNHAFLEFLLQNKANPNVSGKGADAEQPIVLAAAKRDLRSVQLLLRYKANANLFNKYSAIQKAVQYDHFPMVRALIKGGANPNLGLGGKVCKGRLALDIAYRGASERVIDILLDNRALTQFECNKASAANYGRSRLLKRAKSKSRNH